VQEAFGIVLYVVVGVGLIVAVFAASGVGKLYDQIGHGEFSINDGSDRPAFERSGAAEPAGIRDEEIRQMLEARNAVRAERGKPAIDVEAEMAALARPAVDQELLDEVRALVEIRNLRRIKKGEPPLDVEAEIARQLRELT
jgi:hypothetical protein